MEIATGPQPAPNRELITLRFIRTNRQHSGYGGYARLCVSDREARADCQCGKLIDRIAASAPVRKLLIVEALGNTRLPFSGYRPDHRAGVELATIDALRAAETAADLCIVSLNDGRAASPHASTA